MADGHRIGIVGSGIAGSGLAYFLRQSLADAELVVFERRPSVGGRIRDVTVAGRTCEVGGKLIHTRNRYLRSFVDELGLETRDTSELSEERLGIWDGDSFALETAERDWLTVLQLLWRYRLSLRSALSEVSDAVRQVDRIYEPPRSETGFATPVELVRSLDLEGLVRRSGYEFFAERGVSDRFVREFVDGAARSIYAQDASMHALACLVVLAAVEEVGSTFAVEGGNVQLPRSLLDSAGAEVLTDTPVREVRRREGVDSRPTYAVETAGDATTGGAFDAVCLAAPLELAGIDLNGIDDPPSREYLAVTVRVVVGRLDPRYFGKHDVADVPGFVVTQAGTDDPFMFLLKRADLDGDTAIYQLWNRRGSETDLPAVFADVSETRETTWQAFPRLHPGVEMPPFRLCHGCYYVNAMESVASAMEMEAIGSRNVANLLVEDLSPSSCGGDTDG